MVKKMQTLSAMIGSGQDHASVLIRLASEVFQRTG